MGTLKKILTGAAGGVGLLTLVGTASAQEAQPDLGKITTNAETLIKGTEKQKDLRGIEHRFRNLATNAERRAIFLKIKELLPTINEEISNWNRDYTDNKTAFPQSENIGKLQDLLGIRGKARDEQIGPDVSRKLLYLASKSLTWDTDNEIPDLKIENHLSLSNHLKAQAPKRYANYLEKVSADKETSAQAVTKKLVVETDRAAKLTELAFQSCTGEKLAVDKDKFVRNIVEALDTEGGDINAAIGEGCKDILELAKPEDRESLLTSLQANLAEDITAMRDVITSEHEKVQLRALIEKYPVLAKKGVDNVYNQRGRGPLKAEEQAQVNKDADNKALTKALGLDLK